MIFTINGINEVSSPLLVIIPVILFSLSGYAIGRMISKLRMVNSTFLTDLVYGNLILNFVFISGFIFFGVVTFAAKQYFDIFTYTLVALSIVGTYLLIKLALFEFKRNERRDIKSFLLYFSSSRRSPSPSPSSSGASKVVGDTEYCSSISSTENEDNYNYKTYKIAIVFGIGLFCSILIYHAVLIYYHPIFNEYDSLYYFLPISKSILLGNGLNHDYYTGSDVSIRFPPFTQALNAWLIYSFGYSSLRMFPIYFILFGALAVYHLAKSITRDSFLRLFASIVFLITPATLVVSSRFSLQEDLSFIFFLTASFFFLSEIISDNNNKNKDKDNYTRDDLSKPNSTHLVMLVVSLALLPLSREIGLIISIAILFLVPAIKFTLNNLKLRALFTVLSLSPLYVLTIYDIYSNGFTYTITIRLMTLILANSAIFYLVAQVKDQNRFSTLVTFQYLKYLFPLMIPLIFILINVVTFTGPYPTIIFSNKFHQSLELYRSVLGIQNKLYLQLGQALQTNIPRLDLLFAAIAVGSVFLFLKILGFVELIYRVRINPHYAVIIILLVLIFVIWVYLLGSDYTQSGIRHIAYFIPLLTIVVVAGLIKRTESYMKLYYYGLIVLCSFYFLFDSIVLLNYDDHFGSLWIDPFTNPYLSTQDLRLAAAVFGALVILSLMKDKISQWLRKYNLERYMIIGFTALLLSQFYILANSGLVLAPLKKTDNKPQDFWEQHVVEPINYLKSAERGKVLSVRAPAIAFLANRTNFDVYSPFAFNYILPLLTSGNSTLLNERLSELDIHYIVIPNQNNPLYQFVHNLMKESSLIQLLNTDPQIEKIRLENFDVYKYNPTFSGMNLLDNKHTWKPYGSANILDGNSTLTVQVATDESSLLFSRVALDTQLNMSERPLLFSVDYMSRGDATFYTEIRDTQNKVLWSNVLNNTDGKLVSESYILPPSVAKKPIEFRLYVITHTPGEDELILRKAHITYT